VLTCAWQGELLGGGDVVPGGGLVVVTGGGVVETGGGVVETGGGVVVTGGGGVVVLVLVPIPTTSPLPPSNRTSLQP